MDWDEPRLAELRVPDEQHPALEIDVRPLEPQRFAGTKPRRREQANECRIGVGSQSFRGRQSTGCRDQIRDFLIGKDVRLDPAPLAGQDPCRWDLVARVVRAQPGRESPDLTESAGPRGALHIGRGEACGPNEYYWLLLAESHLTRQLFGSMLQRIWALPVPTGRRVANATEFG
jgi:hypothetical protein